MKPTQSTPDQPSPAPDLAPRPNQILAVPATVELAQQDYADGADVRAVMAQQDARHS